MIQPTSGRSRVPAHVNEATQAIRERNRQLQFLSETFPEGVVYQYMVTADQQRLLTYLGRGAEQMFGEPPPGLPADVQWLTDRILPADEPGIAAAGEVSRQLLTRFDHDVRIQRRDGTIRWLSFRTQPRELDDGGVIWDGVILDVTKQHVAQDTARRQVEFLAALNQTTVELLGRRTVGELLQVLAERAAPLLRSPHAEISLLEGDDLVVRAYSKGREYLAGDRVTRADRALSWRAIDTRAAVMTDNYAADPDARDLYRSRAICAAAVFPIVRGTTCVGVLGVAREEPATPFTQHDLDEGTALAQMAALVLHNAAIHEEAVRESEARTIALRESEERFRGVFDKSPLVIALLSVPDGRVVEVNAAAQAAFGHTREEAIGRTSVELNLWVDLDLRARYVEQLRREGAMSGFEAQMRRKNGEVFTVLYSGSLVTIGGKPYSLNLLQDITGRKQSEAARDRSLALMRATLESTADGILVVNADGHIENFNGNFAEMWQLEPPATMDVSSEAALLRTILDQLVEPEKFLASVRDLYAESFEEVFDELHCKDGRVFERYSRPQFVNDRPAGRVWSFRDITDRRFAEAALRASEERFRVLAEMSPVGIFSSDTSGRCTFVNRRWCEIAGLSPDEAVGDGWKSAIHPDDRATIEKNWDEAVQSSSGSSAEYRFMRPDGTVTWLVGQSRPQHDPDGRFVGYVGTITDVTSLKLAEEERKRIEAQLRQSRKMESLGTLAGGIAHDFNNILNGTFGFIDLARLELPPEHPAQSWLDRIAGSSLRARELVRQILTFSRKSEGERIAQRLHPVITEALRLLRSSLPAMVELETRIASNAPAVLADATQIHQVVLNLCTNAWHALPARGGKISVTLEGCMVTKAEADAQPELLAGEWTRLSVADNGCGMDATTLEHIFEPFFTTKETGTGTGLGLAVVHGIVKSHGGAILVQSTVGVGSTFQLYFPTVKLAPEKPSSSSAETPRGHGERILVVDDDPVSGFALEKIIESLGYAATRITRPEEALARFAAAPNSCDLVVSDLAMPGMSGTELIEHLVRIRPDLPVIVVSGYVDTVAARLLEKSAARAVLRKPVSRDEIGRAIAEHLPTLR